jgi:uncharacterized damage-inducible protein DinB
MATRSASKKATRKTTAPFVITDSLIAAYSTNNRINLYLVRNLPEEAWRAKPLEGKGRDIASIVAHIHNVRLMWLKAVGVTDLPPKLERTSVTREQAIQALEASWQAVEDVLRKSLHGDGRIKGFKPDVAGFLAYLVSHDAHHRGQIAMLARQLGHPVSQSVMFGMWEWGKR